jgi:4-alpha-glucanotransferase
MTSPGWFFERRSAGVLLHPTSLPGANGVLGASARLFIDWLASAGCTVWQVLPLGPVGADGSPYWSRADGAINSRLIDRSEWVPAESAGDEFSEFCASNADWLEDYALFEALAANYDGAPWWQWPVALRDRDPGALWQARQQSSTALHVCRVEQWNAQRQWQALRAYAAQRQVQIFGDLPIYVAPDSVSVWAQRNQFQLNPDGTRRAVAGVPPDYFSEDGQLWGNPLYDWQQAASDGFAFWRQRLGWAQRQFDLLRIDHFRGLASYWSVPATAASAREGRWVDAPGAALLAALRAQFPDLLLVAEDLGVITPDVTALRRDHALPGMRVMQFGFDGSGDNPHLPHNYSSDVVAYSGTHDNDTTLGWYRSLPADAAVIVERYLGLRSHHSDRAVVDGLLRALWTSVAPLAIAPLQDVLALGSGARLNVPGTSSGNWGWRFAAGALGDERARDLRAMLQICGRSSRSYSAT